MNPKSMWMSATMAKDTARLAEELQFIEEILVLAIEFEQYYHRPPSAADVQQERHRIAAKGES